MKKSILFLCSILILGISSCTKTTYIDRENPNRTVRFQINSSDWKSTDGGVTWVFETDQIPEIDNLILASGTVLADISFDNSIWIPLNTVKSGVSYRFDYSDSYILVEAQYSGGFADDILPKPNAATLKVLLFDSQLID